MITGVLKSKSPKQLVKLALIPVLSIGLLVALWTQPKSQPAETSALPTQVKAVADTTAASAQAETSAKFTWPKARIEDVIAFNPFEPEPIDEAGQATEETAAIDAYGRPVATQAGEKSRPRLVASGSLQAIFVDAQGAAALFDSHLIRVGDTLPSGGRVAEITAEGIKLEGR